MSSKTQAGEPSNYRTKDQQLYVPPRTRAGAMSSAPRGGTSTLSSIETPNTPGQSRNPSTGGDVLHSPTTSSGRHRASRQKKNKGKAPMLAPRSPPTQAELGDQDDDNDDEELQAVMNAAAQQAARDLHRLRRQQQQQRSGSNTSRTGQESRAIRSPPPPPRQKSQLGYAAPRDAPDDAEPSDDDSSHHGNSNVPPPRRTPRNPQDEVPKDMTPVSGPPKRRYDTKWEHPVSLSDGKTGITFRDWCQALAAKMRASGYMDDSQYTEQERIDYAFSRTEGEARELLKPRIPTGFDEFAFEDEIQDDDPIRSLNELLKALWIRFYDPTEKQRKQDEFWTLFMEPSEGFRDFKLRFLALAASARIRRTDYFSHMRMKVTERVTKQMASKMFDIKGDFDVYCSNVESLENEYLLIEEKRSRITKKTAAARTNDKLSPSSYINQVPFTRRLKSPDKPLPTSPKQQNGPNLPRHYSGTSGNTRSSATPNVKEVLCYACNEPGHIARDCPHPKANQLAELTDWAYQFGINSFGPDKRGDAEEVDGSDDDDNANTLLSGNGDA